MNKRLAGCLAVASVAGLALLSACASQPASASAAAPRLMDLSQVPPLQNAPPVFEPAYAARWSNVAPSDSDLAYHAMLMGTQGMPAGEVAAGPQTPLPPGNTQLAPGALWVRPKLVFPALQPEAVPVQTEGEDAWKKPLPPLPHLAGK